MKTYQTKTGDVNYIFSIEREQLPFENNDSHTHTHKYIYKHKS